MDMITIGYVVGIIIWGVVWGVATNKVIENKGYSENWFWWGFFFGFIAFIVACTKSEKKKIGYQTNSIISSSPKPGSWQCFCGRTNDSYVSTCACGKNKRDVELKRASTNAAKDEKESEKIAAVKEYKALLDSGIITEKEFEEKKQQLLK